MHSYALQCSERVKRCQAPHAPPTCFIVTSSFQLPSVGVSGFVSTGVEGGARTHNGRVRGFRRGTTKYMHSGGMFARRAPGALPL